MFKTNFKVENTEKNLKDGDVFDWMSSGGECDTDESGTTNLIKSSWMPLTFNKTDDGSFGGSANVTKYRSNSALTDKAVNHLESITPIGIKITEVNSSMAKVSLAVEQTDALRKLFVKNIFVVITYICGSGNMKKTWGVPVDNGQPQDLILLFRDWSAHKSVLSVMNDSSFVAGISFELEQHLDQQTAKELLLDNNLPACV